ncbi:ATP-binding protein [Candidatus Saccharibacteria bacterium]|nr:ATP-binding protein [Candidatus Saccharibacteria bacterium]
MNKLTLYLMLGYPGAGKTTAAKAIHELTGAVHVSSDKERVELFSSPSFSQHEHDELYEALDNKTESLLRKGISVIYDANLNRLQHRTDKYDIAERTGAQVILVWVKTHKELAKERAAHTSRLHLWPKHELPHDMFERIAGLIEEPLKHEPYVEIDGTKITAEYMKERLKAHEA